MIQGSLEIEIAGIEAQLKAVKAEIRNIKEKEAIIKIKKPLSFANLYGLWKGKVDLSYGEIKASEFKVGRVHPMHHLPLMNRKNRCVKRTLQICAICGQGGLKMEVI